jgi:uncharacterized protein GlcG (DUF336 family)
MGRWVTGMGQIVPQPARAGPRSATMTYAVGGVTIKAGETAIGAIGVSGAPGGQFDEECARAALAKIKERVK